MDTPPAPAAVGVSRDFDQAGRAADAQARYRRVDLHVAGVSDLRGDERYGAAQHVERCSVIGAAFLINEIVHRNPRVRFQGERRIVVECDAERTVDAGLQNVALVDRLAKLQRARGIVVGDGSAALQRRDAADRIGVRLRLTRRCGRWRDRLRRRRRRGRYRSGLSCWRHRDLSRCMGAPKQHTAQNRQRQRKSGPEHGAAQSKEWKSYLRRYHSVKCNYPPWWE